MFTIVLLARLDHDLLLLDRTEPAVVYLVYERVLLLFDEAVQVGKVVDAAIDRVRVFYLAFHVSQVSGADRVSILRFVNVRQIRCRAMTLFYC
mgnify:CR=1 FL=1